MPDYRLYFLENNHIRHVVEMVCDCDEHAIECVSQHADGRTMELWHGSRVVRRYERTEPKE